LRVGPLRAAYTVLGVFRFLHPPCPLVLGVESTFFLGPQRIGFWGHGPLGPSPPVVLFSPLKGPPFFFFFCFLFFVLGGVWPASAWGGARLPLLFSCSQPRDYKTSPLLKQVWDRDVIRVAVSFFPLFPPFPHSFGWMFPEFSFLPRYIPPVFFLKVSGAHSNSFIRTFFHFFLVRFLLFPCKGIFWDGASSLNPGLTWCLLGVFFVGFPYSFSRSLSCLGPPVFPP